MLHDIVDDNVGCVRDVYLSFKLLELSVQGINKRFIACILVEEGQIFVFLSRNGSLPRGNVTVDCGGATQVIPCTTYAV